MCAGTPGKPEKLTVTSVTSACITLKWRSVDDAGGNGFLIKRYIVLYSSSQGNMKADVKASTEHGPDVEHIVCELMPGTNYSFQVVAESQLRRGKLSESVTATTDKQWSWSSYVFS